MCASVYNDKAKLEDRTWDESFAGKLLCKERIKWFLYMLLLNYSSFVTSCTLRVANEWEKSLDLNHLFQLFFYKVNYRAQQ